MRHRYLVDKITVRFVAIFLVGAKGHSHNFILSHEKFGIGEGLSQRLEVVGGHVIEGEDVDVLEPSHKGMHLIDDKLFVLPGFGGHLGEGNYFVLLRLRHQQ